MKMNKLTSKQYIQMVKDAQATELDITTRKNADYSGTQFAFKNFDLVEQLGICSAEEAILVRMADKLSRVSTLIHSGSARVDDEKITDTLMDLSNYARILMIYILTKEVWTPENSTDTATVSSETPE